MLKSPSFANVNDKLLKRIDAAMFFDRLNEESNKMMIQMTAEAEKLWSGLLTCETHKAEQFILMLIEVS